MTLPRPRPALDGDAAPFWHALADGRLVLARCAACLAFRHPPRPRCARCGSNQLEWHPSAGTGHVWTYTIVHSPTLPAFAESVPYGVVVVRLDEGVFMVSQVLDCAPHELEVGMPVVVTPTVVDGVALPLARRATEPSPSPSTAR